MGVVVAVQKDDTSLHALDDLSGKTVLMLQRTDTLRHILERELVHAGVCIEVPARKTRIATRDGKLFEDHNGPGDTFTRRKRR